MCSTDSLICPYLLYLGPWQLSVSWESSPARVKASKKIFRLYTQNIYWSMWINYLHLWSSGEPQTGPVEQPLVRYRQVWLSFLFAIEASFFFIFILKYFIYFCFFIFFYSAFFTSRKYLQKPIAWKLLTIIDHNMLLLIEDNNLCRISCSVCTMKSLLF
jgi:hypothetical protein